MYSMYSMLRSASAEILITINIKSTMYCMYVHNIHTYVCTYVNVYVDTVHTCKSLAGFQSISYNTRYEAPIRFNPTPPALELNRNTAT